MKKKNIKTRRKRGDGEEERVSLREEHPALRTEGMGGRRMVLRLREEHPPLRTVGSRGWEEEGGSRGTAIRGRMGCGRSTSRW